MLRTGRRAVGYIGALCLLGLGVAQFSPSLVRAASTPDDRSHHRSQRPPEGRPTIRSARDLSARIVSRTLAAAETAAAADPTNRGLRFDGIDDRVTFGAAPALGAATFTIETWFRRDGAGATATTGSGGVVAVPLVTKGNAETEGSNRDTNYFFGIDGKRRVLVADFEDTGNGANHPAFGSTPICDGVWYHAAAVYDGTTWRLYLNGLLAAQGVGGAFTPRADSSQHDALGTALNSSGLASGAFLGALDEVRIWNVARTGPEIQSTMGASLANASGLIGRWALDEGATNSIADSTASGVKGTLLNGVAWQDGTPFLPTPTPAGAYAARLKGTTAAGDYVSLGAAGLGAATFTVETWFKRDGAGVTTSTGSGGLTAVVPLVTKGRSDGDASARDVNYFLGLSGNVLAADFEEGVAGNTPGLNHPIVGVTNIQDNVWHHGAVTYDGVTLQLYLDGLLEAAAVVNQPPRADSVEHAAIGTALNWTGVASGYFAGSLDEVRIWNHARTSAQIGAAKDREIAAAPGLLGRWSFNECCGQAPDSSGNALNGTIFGTSWTWVAGAPLATVINAPPVVDAGSDQTVTLPAMAVVSGSVSDDGLSGSSVTTSWSRTSGPGTVAFGNPASLTSTAVFSVAGTYVLTLTANDGEFSTSDSITVQVNPLIINLPPVVGAGTDQIITLPATATLSGSVTDDGVSGSNVTVSWSTISGPGAVTFTPPNAATTTAGFSTAGTYVLMLSASDGVLTATDVLVVTVLASPTGGDGGIDFGGSNAYVTFGPAPGLGAATFTIEAWFRRDGTGVTTTTGTGGVTAVPLVTKGRSQTDGTSVDMNYFLGIATGDVLVADFEEGAAGASPGANHPILGVTPIQNNVWYHAAATYDGTRWQLFLNGVLERELTVGQPPRSDSIQHAAIGSALTSTGAAGGFFNGAIDEVRIWNVARTEQQIAEAISREISSAPGLLARWGLNEGTGATVLDSSGNGITGTITATSWSWSQGAPFTIVVNNAPDVPKLDDPTNGETSVDVTAQLTVEVSDRDDDRLSTTFYGRRKSAAAPDFTLMTIPDTQHYVDNTSFPQTFTAQTNWIVANRAPLNIAFVSHLGDVTEHQDQSEIEWQRADTSLSILDQHDIPWSLSPGNHDQTPNGVANFYDLYFPVSRFLGRPWYIGYLGQEETDPINRQNKNNYELFSVGSLDFLIIHIEHDWPGYAVTWADKIIKRYPNRRVILSTHLFLNTSNARPTSPVFRPDGTSAESVWQQIIRPNCNVFMVINGHYPGEGRRTDLNACGQPVHQVVMDYQSRANGGDGWLRYFTFKPSENKIYAYTYSPTRNNGLGEFETDDTSQFVLDYDMQGAPFAVIGTESNVASGSESSIGWSGLAAGTEYEWYVSVNDRQKTTTGPVWSFTTRTRENAAPLAIDDLHVVAEDTVLTVAAPGVLGNDIDVDGDPLTAVVTSSPGHGVVTLDANGRFVYTPDGNYSGADSFTYRTSDGTSHSNVATVNVLVTAVNDVPVATAENYNATADVALIVPAPGVLANDTDLDSGVLMAVLVKGPDHGTLLLNTNGSFAYTATGTSQTDSFSYVASDGQSTSNVVTVSLAITIPTVAVPDVVNLTVAAATIAITNAGLTVGTVTTEQSTSVPAGSIISQSPTAGTVVRPPVPVSLVVSSGAPPPPPPPVTLAVDKVVTSFGSGTRTTAPFSTATAGEVLVAFVASDGPSTSQTMMVTGAGLTWTLVRRANVQRGASEIWTATAANQLSNVTVTSRQTVMGYTQSLTVVAFRGAAGVGASAVANGATGAPSVTLNATTAGSFVYGVGNDWDRAVARVLGPGQTMVHQWLDTASGDTYWVQALSTSVTAPAQVRLNDTSPTTDRWNMAAVEIVPK